MKRNSKRRLLLLVLPVLGLVITTAFVWNRNVCQLSFNRAKEGVLRQDLFMMRAAIDKFTMDNGKAPQSLPQLVTAGYLKEVPRDPFTESSNTWKLVQEDQRSAVNKSQPGITDVRSGSENTGSDGQRYSEW